jgi:hypothetical protein
MGKAAWWLGSLAIDFNAAKPSVFDPLKVTLAACLQLLTSSSLASQLVVEAGQAYAERLQRRQRVCIVHRESVLANLQAWRSILRCSTTRATGFSA